MQGSEVHGTASIRFANSPTSVASVWLEPERYCRVRSLGWTRRGRLRGASFAGLIER